MFQRKYNLVVSSYTLLDLPSQETRLKTISNLWSKTQDFLVLVEKGTSAGFKVSFFPLYSQNQKSACYLYVLKYLFLSINLHYISPLFS